MDQYEMSLRFSFVRIFKILLKYGLMHFTSKIISRQIMNNKYDIK